MCHLLALRIHRLGLLMSCAGLSVFVRAAFQRTGGKSTVCIASRLSYTMKKSTAIGESPIISLTATANGRGDQNYVDEDAATTSTLTSPSGQKITLIGTAHNSQRSADQVQRLLQDIRPNVIMIEIDPSRVVGKPSREGSGWRQGIKAVRKIMGVEKTIRTVEDIELPVRYQEEEDDVAWFVRPVRNAVLSMATAQALEIYQREDDELSELLGTERKGECWVAMEMAKDLAECHTLVLGDRSPVTTIRRTVKLGLELHDDDEGPLGFMIRQEKAMEEELTQLEERVRTRLLEEGAGLVEDATVQASIIETMKSDADFRKRLYHKLDQEVPEYAQAVQKERDYIMAESIRRELDAPNVERVAGVVGLGHVPGMVENLEAMFANEPVPLERMKVAP